MSDQPATVKSAWHLVALSRSVRAGARRAVTVAGMPIVLFRTRERLGALVDRCPHRNYPLSRGRVTEGGLECAYHGWRFAPSGACVEVPGCALVDAPAARLAATAVRVVERQGGIFVCLSSDGPPEPVLPPIPDELDHDHFWWEQGVWRGHALDAIENVMDPFHTNHLHHGFIRRRDRRMPVDLQVNSHGDGIEMVIEQALPDVGLMSRFLEPDRSRSVTRYYPPTVVQARWEGKQRLTLCVTAFFTPSTENSFLPFARFTTPKGAAPAWLKEAAIRLFLAPVIAQDREALQHQSEVMARFGQRRFLQGPGDILGNRLHRLWNGDTLESGADAPVAARL
jgi:phenylpropionate dioxygenase-like ring-hydroxylating dioxygenase large terminal subunit